MLMGIQSLSPRSLLIALDLEFEAEDSAEDIHAKIPAAPDLLLMILPLFNLPGPGDDR